MDSQRNHDSLDGRRPPNADGAGDFLASLLARDERAGAEGVPRGGIDAALLTRLGTALMHRTELHAMRRRKGPAGPVGHRMVRHAFLLADGGDAVLWEVEHNTAPDGRTRHRLYARQEEAEAYVRERFGEPPLLDLWPRPGGDPEADREEMTDPVLGSILGSGVGQFSRFDPRSDPDFVSGAAGATDPRDDSGSDLGRMIAEIFFSARRAEQHRSRRARHARHDYRTDDAAEHARRLLRRAENPNRPGETVRHLLTSAVGHETTLVTLRNDVNGDFVIEWALYEHAFLLADGAEISLWELEHTITPDGHPVCEVYLDESTARDSVDRHRAGS